MLQFIGKKYKYFFYIFLFLLLSTINNLNLIKSKNSITKVKIIEVVGLKNELNQQIKNKLNYLLNSNIYNIDEKKIKKNLNEYTFLEKYNVFKVYPSKIIFHLEQTDLLATTMLNNKIYIVGANGKLIDSQFVNDEIQLPNIFGVFSEKSFVKLIKKIKDVKFNYDEIKNFYFFPSKRWDIEMKNNLIIKLPKNNLESSLIKINKIINNGKFNNKKIIDLRIKNQVIVSDE